MLHNTEKTETEICFEAYDRVLTGETIYCSTAIKESGGDDVLTKEASQIDLEYIDDPTHGIEEKLEWLRRH